MSRLMAGNRGKTFLIYALMLVGAILIFFLIQQQGESLSQVSQWAAQEKPATEPQKQMNTLLHVLLALAVVIVTARGVGGVFKFFHQPPVIGEVLGGILLGPSFLGTVAPKAYHYLLPDFAAPFLGIISQLGVILYMFIVGLELDLKVFRRSGHVTLAISHASIVFPFLLGVALALKLFPFYAGSRVSFTSFSLFLGISLSVTAFPVLARILTDRKVQKTRLGTIALTCAAVDDVTAWCLLALVVSIVQASIAGAVATLVMTAVYLVFMFVVAKPLIARSVPFLETFDRMTESGMAMVVVAILLSSLATEFIGIHALFGAFLLGAIVPHNSRVASELSSRLEDLVRIMFLPAFFAFTGMRTQIGLLDSVADWKLALVIVTVATLGKFGGTFVAARLTGLNTRDSASLGILMNTRGLVELIVLNIGLDLGVISSKLFTMLVVMALVTTFATTPILHLLTRRHPWEESPSS